ncbi:MAG: transposase [Candidatus Kapaibacterium sp.]
MNTNHYNPKIHHRRSIRLSGYDYSQEGAYFITICCQDKVCRFGTVENDKMMLNECGLIAANEWIALPNRFINIEVDVFQIMPNHIHGIIIVKDVGATLAVAQSFMGETAYAGQPQGIAPTVAQDGMGETADTGQPQGIAPTVAQSFMGETAYAGQPQGIAPTVAQSFMGETAYAGQPQGIAPTQVVHGTIPAIIGAYKSLVSNGCLKIYKSKNKPMGKLWQRNYYEHIIRNEQSYRTISQYVTDNPAKWAFDKLFTV